MILVQAEIPGTDRAEIPKAEVLKNLVEFEDSIGEGELGIEGIRLINLADIVIYVMRWWDIDGQGFIWSISF